MRLHVLLAVEEEGSGGGTAGTESPALGHGDPCVWSCHEGALYSAVVLSLGSL